MYGMAAGCHSPVAVSGSDGNACKVTLSVRGLAKTVSSLSYIKVFCCIVPVRGSLLHGHVTAISKSVAEDWKPSGNRYNGTYGLQIWKVAQLVEQETIPSPRFDSWLSDLTRKNYKPADCGKHFQHIRHLAAVRCLSFTNYGLLTQQVRVSGS